MAPSRRRRRGAALTRLVLLAGSLCLGARRAAAAPVVADVAGLLRVSWTLRAADVTFNVTATQPAGCAHFPGGLERQGPGWSPRPMMSL
jgi:hypothetical protein